VHGTSEELVVIVEREQALVQQFERLQIDGPQVPAAAEPAAGAAAVSAIASVCIYSLRASSGDHVRV
jgi:hypothetical protein